MKKPENREIDGQQYLIYYMGPEQQIRMLRFIFKTVGQPLGMLAEDDEVGLNFLDNTKVIGSFIKHITENLDEDAIIEKCKVILGTVERKNETGNYAKVSMEKDFHGELLHLFKVVKVALEVNFGNFLGASTGLAKSLQGRMQTSQTDAPVQ